MPGARCTHSLVCAQNSEVCTRVFTAEAPEITRHSPRDGFTVSSALSPGTTALLTPSSARRVGVPANLTPASGRQNHTASPSVSGALVSRSAAATAPRLTFMTIAKRPLHRGRMRESYHRFLKNGIFFFARVLDIPNHTESLHEFNFRARGSSCWCGAKGMRPTSK